VPERAGERRTTLHRTGRARTSLDSNQSETVVAISRCAHSIAKQLIDLDVSGILSEAAYVDGNVALDQELHALRGKKADLVRGLPLLHTESVDLSIRQFCDAARARFVRSS
jgi:hypothetical protein